MRASPYKKTNRCKKAQEFFLWELPGVVWLGEWKVKGERSKVKGQADWSVMVLASMYSFNRCSIIAVILSQRSICLWCSMTGDAGQRFVIAREERSKQSADRCWDPLNKNISGWSDETCFIGIVLWQLHIACGELLYFFARPKKYKKRAPGNNYPQLPGGALIWRECYCKLKSGSLMLWPDRKI